jgi:hypothetical protein
MRHPSKFLQDPAVVFLKRTAKAKKWGKHPACRKSGVSILLAANFSSTNASWKLTPRKKWGKHPACRRFFLDKRKLEAYATVKTWT